MKKLLGVLVAGAFALNVLGALPAQADPVPPDATWEEVWFPSGDGTMLHADLFLPKDRKDDERHPVILAIGPYFGTGGSVPPSPTRQPGPVLRFNDLITEGRIFERGYAYVQVDSRGYGGSDGCYDLGGAGEQLDAASAVEWAADQDWSNGRVGMWGKSYDAWTQVMALAHNPEGLEAAVIQSPLIEAYRGFFMNGVHYDSGWYLTPGLYGAYDLAPPSTTDSESDEYIYPAKGTATNPDCYAQNLSMTAIPDHSIPYWQERDVVEAAGKSKVPVLWSHGFNDVNTKPDNFLPVYSKLKGPKRAWVGQWAHDRGNEVTKVGREGFMDEAMAWFDHYLKGLPLKRYPTVEVQDNEGGWRAEKQWPPADARLFSFDVNPGTYIDETGSSASGPVEGVWSVSPPAPYDLHIVGTPKLSVDLETAVPAVNVIGLLYDVDPEGKAKLISRGAFWVRDPGSARFELYPVDWRVRKGHRLALAVTGSDDSMFVPLSTLTEVSITGGSLTMSFLRYLRVNNLEGGPALGMNAVPRLTMDQATIEGGATKMKFPPRLKRRK